MPDLPVVNLKSNSRAPTLLTRNKRLSRVLQQKSAARALAGGAQAWCSDDILPLSAFCQRLWDEFGLFQSSQRPLSISQARTLWLQTGARAPEFDGLGFRDRVLESMFESYCLCGNWLLNSQDLASVVMSEDQALFTKICTRFEQVLQERNLFASSHIISQLLKLDLHAPGADARQIEMHGFLNFSASEIALIEKLRQGGDHILVVEARTSDLQHARSCSLPDRDKELLAAGHWARNHLLTNPESRLAIIVPELSRETDRKLRLIHDGLRPGWQFDPETLNDIDTSMGRPLSVYPWLQSLILGMEALLSPMPFSRISAFLRDPGLTGDLQSDCALLELRLRDLSEQRWQFSGLERQLRAEEHESALADRLRVLADLEAQAAKHTAPQTPEYWARLFDKFALGLLAPVSQAESGLEFRLRNGWRDALNELAAQGLVQQLMPLQAAWKFVRQVLSTTLYQTEVHQSRLAVLGPLEAIEHDFDAIWISGLDSRSWPPTVQADAYIPRSIQSRLKMPGSEPALDRAFADKVIAALSATSRHLVCSWAGADQDIVLHATQAIAGLEHMDEADRPASCRFAESALGRAHLDDIRLDAYTPLGQSEPVSGGSGILSLQKEYPLAAFSTYRLGAAPLNPPVEGVGHRVRGRIIHAAAQQLYSSGRAQALATKSDTLYELCSAATRAFRNTRDPLLQLLLDREAERAASILRNLQHLDADRPQFEVFAVEMPVTLAFDTLEIRLQLDRLDRLNAGLLIIDYKTGREMKGFSREGLPGELQLAVYAHAIAQDSSEPVEAVGICQLHTTRVNYQGIETGNEPGEFTAYCKNKPGADDLLELWSAEVLRLAKAFEQGRTEIPAISKFGAAPSFEVFSSIQVEADDAA